LAEFAGDFRDPTFHALPVAHIDDPGERGAAVGVNERRGLSDAGFV
jgi:hypothetical protein